MTPPPQTEDDINDEGGKNDNLCVGKSNNPIQLLPFLTGVQPLVATLTMLSACCDGAKLG